MVVVWDLACPGDALEWLADHPELDAPRTSGRGAHRCELPRGLLRQPINAKRHSRGAAGVQSSPEAEATL
jgi:hypothetical protein